MGVFVPSRRSLSLSLWSSGVLWMVGGGRERALPCISALVAAIGGGGGCGCGPWW